VIEIDDGIFAVMLHQSAVARHSGRRGIDVGHADRKRYAAGGRSHGGGRDIFLVGKSRIAVMRVRVDQAWNDFHPLGIDDCARRVGHNRRLAESDDLAVADSDIGFDKSARSPDLPSADKQVYFVHFLWCSLRGW
jgi:hypothetical protein